MRTRGLLIRILISVVLIAVLLSRIDGGRVFDILGSASPYRLITAFLFYLLTYFIITARWAVLLYFQGHRIPFFQLFSYYLIGFFFSNFIPTGIGGDVARCIYLSKGSSVPEFFTASVLVERLLGLVATTIIAVLSLPLSDFPTGTKWTVLALAISLWALFIILIIPRSNRLVRKITAIIPGKKVKGFADEVIHSFSLFRFQSLLFGFIFSLLYQFSLILFFFLVGRALNIELSLYNYLAFLPVIWIVGLLPLSINAIGVREAGFAWMFTALGKEPSSGFANSIVGFLIALVASLSGGLLFVLKGKLKQGGSNK